MNRNASRRISRLFVATGIFFCLVGTESCVSNASRQQPREVSRSEPGPLPALWDSIQASTWIAGANFPWDCYGRDVGENAWGHSGLSNQGPSGLRIERGRGEVNPAAERLFWAQRNSEDHALGVGVDFQGNDSAALVFFRFDEEADKSLDETVNLAGQTISADLYFPVGLRGPSSAPTGAMIYFQDINWIWGQSPWTNIQTNTWITLSVRVNDLAVEYPEFDYSRVRTVGIKVASNGQADRFSHIGTFYVDNLVASTAPEIQFDFNSADTRTERELRQIGDGGVQVLRWWLLADLRACLEFTPDGFVQGVQDICYQDIDELLRLARSTKTHLILTWFDFLLGAEPQIVDGVQTFGRADLINDPEKRQSLLDKGISPILDKLANAPEILMFDLWNEPEWMILSSDIDIPAGKRPGEIRAGGIISLATMKEFFSEMIELHRQKSTQQLLTIGSASPRWVALWDDVDVDVGQFHWWTATGEIDEQGTLDFPSPVSKPTFIGEFSTRGDLSFQAPCEILQAARANGYLGAFPWAYRSKDQAALPLLGEETRQCVLSFAGDRFAFVDRGGMSFTSPSSSLNTTIGYARIRPDTGMMTPSGLALEEPDDAVSKRPLGIGSSGRTRTYNPPVNSRMLCQIELLRSTGKIANISTGLEPVKPAARWLGFRLDRIRSMFNML